MDNNQEHQFKIFRNKILEYLNSNEFKQLLIEENLLKYNDIVPDLIKNDLYYDDLKKPFKNKINNLIKQLKEIEKYDGYKSLNDIIDGTIEFYGDKLIDFALNNDITELIQLHMTCGLNIRNNIMESPARDIICLECDKQYEIDVTNKELNYQIQRPLGLLVLDATSTFILQKIWYKINQEYNLKDNLF